VVAGESIAGSRHTLATLRHSSVTDRSGFTVYVVETDDEEERVNVVTTIGSLGTKRRSGADALHEEAAMSA
jgi:hypothetical protein